MRRAYSLIETIVVLALMALMIGLMLPALQKVRSSANNLVCKNNLRQIGLAMHMYYDSYKFLPYACTCPAPWKNGGDPLCQTCNPQNAYSSSKETWWCPYDNRTRFDRCFRSVGSNAVGITFAIRREHAQSLPLSRCDRPDLR